MCDVPVVVADVVFDDVTVADPVVVMLVVRLTVAVDVCVVDGVDTVQS